MVAFLRSHQGATTSALLVLALIVAFLVPASRSLLVADVFGPVNTWLLTMLRAIGNRLTSLL